MSSMLFLVVIAVFVIYIVLGILYESFIHPVTILTGLPFAMFGWNPRAGTSSRIRALTS